MTAEESQAFARRAARFQKRPALSEGSPAPVGVGEWFANEDEDGSVQNGLGVVPVPVSVGRKKMKGKGGLGYTADEVIEVDPVS